LKFDLLLSYEGIKGFPSSSSPQSILEALKLKNK